MLYHFDATEDFLKRLNEIHILLETAEEKQEEKKDTFLKLAVVSLVTKFQVYIESILKEFLYEIKRNQIPYSRLSVYMQLNSVKMEVGNNALINLSKHNKLNEETKQKVRQYILNIHYIVDGERVVDDNLKIKTSFPLGRTGKKELLDLFKQIEGKKNIFADDCGNEEIDLNQLDSLLLTRHLIIHQDRFQQTDTKIKEYEQYIVSVVFYCDHYLNQCLNSFGIHLASRGEE